MRKVSSKFKSTYRDCFYVVVSSVYRCLSENITCDHAMIILVFDTAGGSNKREDYVAEGAAAMCPRDIG